jgi:signal transduction histidine kinase
MKISTSFILLLIVSGTILILIFFSLFIFYLLKLYNKRQIEFYDNINLSKIETEKKILSTRIDVYEETIQRISREIHDNVNQLLTLSKLNLYTIKDNIHADEKIQLTIDLISSAIGELTNISRSLSSEILNENGLFRSIEIEAERLKKLSLINICLEFATDNPPINPEIQLMIYRIFQEATRNSIIHGKATNISIALNTKEGTVYLTIKDDGIGFNYTEFQKSENHKHQGLRNMRKRIELVGGSMNVYSELGKGTNLIFEIPLAPKGILVA